MLVLYSLPSLFFHILGVGYVQDLLKKRYELRKELNLLTDKYADDVLREGEERIVSKSKMSRAQSIFDDSSLKNPLEEMAEEKS